MREKNRKSYSPKKKNKVERERAIESHSKNKKNESSEGGKTSKQGERRNSGSRGRKKFNPRSKNSNARSGSRSGGRSGGRSVGRFKKSELDPSMMVNTTIKPKEDKKDIQTRTFEELNLNPELQSRINKKGFVKTTEIQDKTFEIVSEGKSIIRIANDGTVNAGEFLIPIIE